MTREFYRFSGIQQENRHIRQLQHENKELRAALEEHQNVLELIMSKYRQHMSCLINSTKLEKDMIIHENTRVRTTFHKLIYKSYTNNFFFRCCKIALTKSARWPM